MRIENQVTGIAQSNRLKALGIDQKNAIYFWDEKDNELYRCVDGSAEDVDCVAAFTVAELGVMLAIKRIDEHKNMSCNYSYAHDNWNCRIEHISEYMPGLTHTSGITEAQCKADMLIWLLEHGHTTAEQVNNRLKQA